MKVTHKKIAQLEKVAEPNVLTLITGGLHDKVNELIQNASQEPELAGVDLTGWIEANKNAPTATQIRALELIIKYKLNPFGEEITIAQMNGRWQSYVTVDGCIKLMNQHPAFMGVSFRESPDLDHGIPRWMECTIYRSDRAYPLCIREYFMEIATDHESWKMLPRRMLRHRTLQQACRLAFGVNGGVGAEVTGPLPVPANPIATKEASSHSEVSFTKVFRGELTQSKCRGERTEKLKEILSSRG